MLRSMPPVVVKIDVLGSHPPTQNVDAIQKYVAPPFFLLVSGHHSKQLRLDLKLDEDLVITAMQVSLITLAITNPAALGKPTHSPGHGKNPVNRPPRFKRSQAFLFQAATALILSISLCPCSAAPLAKASGIVIFSDVGKNGNNDAKIFEYRHLLKFDNRVEVQGPDGIPYQIPNSQVKAIVPYPNEASLAKSTPQAAAAKLSETVQTYPASKRYLQTWIDSLQPPPVRPTETPSKGPAINLPDGTKLLGCSLKQISDGKATVAYQGGVRRIPLADLDSTARRTLTASTGEWSFDDPGVSPKDATGKYPKIVCKNGRMLIDAKFLEFSDGTLLFNCRGMTKSVPVDQFPGDPAILGGNVATALAAGKNLGDTTQNSMKTPTSGQSTNGPSLPSNTDSPIADGASFSKKAEELREWARGFAASKQAAAVLEDAAAKQLEAEFTRAGGAELIAQLTKKAGTYLPFTVIAKLPAESFPSLTKNGGEVFEIHFELGREKSNSILVTKTTRITSDGEGSMYIISGGTVTVKLQNGFDSERRVFIEGDESAIDELKKMEKLRSDAARPGRQAEEYRSAAQKVPDQAEQCAKFLEYIGERMARLRNPEFIVSPGLKTMGFSASVKDRAFAGVIEAIKEGSLSEIAAALGDTDSSYLLDIERPVEVWAEKIMAGGPSFMNEAGRVLSSLEEREFSVELFTTTQRVTDESGNNKYNAAYVLIPRPDSYKLHRGTSHGADNPVAPVPTQIEGSPKIHEPIQRISFELPDKRSLIDSDAQGRGYIQKLPVFNCCVAFCLEREAEFLHALWALQGATELQEKAINQDIAAGRIGDEEVVKKAQALTDQYISKLKVLVSKF
jgi:hypothetical protein